MLKHVPLVLALAVVPVAAYAVEQPPKPAQPATPNAIDPEANRMLKQMSDYLASLRSFNVQAFSVDEVVTTAGQKVQVISESKVSLVRPNRMSSERTGAAADLEFLYDGKQMTLVCKTNNTYATQPAPSNIDAMIDDARKRFHIEAPGADLFYSNPYQILTEQVTGGKFVGRETIGGVVTNHLAFTGEEVDWQVWIEDGAQALPFRYVITTKTMKAQPQFTVQFTHWDTSPKIDDASFNFVPPAGATHVQAFPMQCGSQQQSQ
jgi:hypothetical protein